MLGEEYMVGRPRAGERSGGCGAGVGERVTNYNIPVHSFVGPNFSGIQSAVGNNSIYSDTV